MSRLTTCAALAGAAALAAPATASALIQPDQGIAGARVGNSKAEVRTALGAPDAKRNGQNDFGRFSEWRYDGGLRIVFQGRREVTSVATTGQGDRTARGVGVGSRERAVRRRVDGITCESFPGGFRSCHTGDYSAGSRVTDFQIEDGRVQRVVVGIVID